ncbi:hypothetical protein CSB09_03495 [Candidatus Gracilibacteria bacterium]|nr:MAG: hypothetical protein CSB09_03495 [Candidatus Gracilibacteria bacterium]
MRLNYIFSGILAVVFFGSSCFSAFAGTVEEEQCMKILAQTVKTDDLTSVSLPNDVKPTTSDTLDLSDYGKFKEFRLGGRFFKAQRNNIGTILADSNYIKSQVVTFGPKETDFDFPLPGEGDQIKPFYNKLVYTHHIEKYGDFVSCGYLNLQPAITDQYTGLSNQFYKTNGVKEGSSGFEIVDGQKKVTVDGKEYTYLIGKSRVPGLDQNNEPLFYMNIVTVAYDNGSEVFNEYQTFPLQVKAMTDLNDTAGNNYNVADLQQKFLELVDQNTCLQIPHGTEDKLPAGCNGSFSANGPSASAYIPKSKNFFSWLIPSANAALSADEVDSNAKLPTSGSLVAGEIPFSLIKKLDQVPDKVFQAYVRTAVIPNIEQVLAAEKEDRPGDFKEVFMACGIDYKERVSIVIDYLEKLDPKTWDVNNITWKNPRFGDCIVPYPDKTHLDKIIPDSFESNKTAAGLRTGKIKVQTPEDPNYTPEQKKEIENRQKLSKAYNDKILEYSQQLQNGKITQEEYDSFVNELMLRRDAMVEALSSDGENMTKEKMKSEKYSFSQDGIYLSWHIFVGAIMVLVGFLMLLFIVRVPKKN